MITNNYCRMMSRYNAWQNKQLLDCLQSLPEAEVLADRGAFFGSILKTVNHLLWGDKIWMSRLDGGPSPKQGIAESTELCPTLADWNAERYRTDGRIRLWSQEVTAADLKGELTWQSGAMGRDVTRPMAMCVTHLFNHQTHHRGQVHAMITAAGGRAPVTDLAFMPD